MASIDGPSGAGSASGNGGSSGGGDVTVLESQPRPPAPPAGPDPSPPPADAAPPGDGDDEPPPDDPGPEGPGQTVVACTENGGGCIIMNIAVSDGSNSCIQLILDDCEGSAQAGLPVTLPVRWRLGSASVSRSAEGCVPGAQFNPMTTTAIVDASGSISWDLTTRQPSQIVLDLTLEPSRTALDPSPINLANSDLVDPLSECE